MSRRRELDLSQPRNRRRYPVIITTTLFAAFLWLSLAMNGEYEWTFSLPLTVKQIPQNMALVTPLPGRVDVRARGIGWQLAGLGIFGHPEVRMYLSDFPAGPVRVPLTRELTIKTDLPAGVEILGITPDEVNVRFEPLVRKRVPVVPRYSMSFRKGFGIAGYVTAEPESLLISGGGSVLGSISRWETAPVALGDVHMTTSFETSPLDTLSQEIAVEPRRITVTVPVDLIAERTFEDVPIEVVGAPPSRKALIYPPTVVAVLRGGATRMGSVSNNEVTARIYYSALLRDTLGVTMPILEYPSDLELVSIQPSQLHFVIQKVR